MKHFFFIIVLIIGCKANSSVENAPEEIVNQSFFSEDSRENNGNGISIKFKNVSGGKLSVMRPFEPTIEKWSEDGWQKISVLYCDCEAPCPAPPQDRLIDDGGYFYFSWDGIMEECITESTSRKTVKTDALPGQYRVVYSFKTEESSLEKLESRFVISK